MLGGSSLLVDLCRDDAQSGQSEYPPKSATYGVTYLNKCDFESKAVAAYAFPASTTASTWNFEVRKPSGCNITFTPLFTN